MRTEEAFVKNVLQSTKVAATITRQHEEKFREIDQWLQGAHNPGLVVFGPTGSGKTVLLHAIVDILQDCKEKLNSGEVRKYMDGSECLIRQELRGKHIRGVRADEIVRVAHLSGHEGLFYAKGCIAQSGVLLIDGVGSIHEEDTVTYAGWDATRTKYIKGKISPIAELLSFRCDRGLPTIISTQLNFPQFAKRYGESVADKMYGACGWLSWDFGKSFR